MIPKTVKATCARCGANIPLGRTKYHMHVEVTSDFDGYLPDMDNEAEEIDKVLAGTGDASAESLEDDVYQEFALTLCRSCARQIVEDIRESLTDAPAVRTPDRSKMQ